MKVILAFDEAHVLVKKFGTANSWSHFSELRRVIRDLRECPVFAVFLTTTGKVYPFTPAPRHDNSGRVQRGHFVLPAPFTELGFDQLAEKVSDGSATLDQVSNVGFMAKLGRPLYVCIRL